LSSGVSDISVSWVAVSRSTLRRRLRVWAHALTGAIAAALLLVLSLDSEFSAAAGAAVAVLAVAWLSARLEPAPPAGCWRVAHDGTVSVRWDGEEDGGVATAAFVSSFLIVLRRRRRLLEVWRDATPAPVFRRLSAAVRWRIQRESSALASDRPDAADRT
jgi:hypothetical protein